MLLFTLTTDAKAIVSGEELDSLLYAVAAENRDALERLYRRTCASVYSFALSVLKDPHDAEDVLQETYLAIWRGAAGYASRGKPMAWMMTVTRNLCLQRLREREKTADLSQDEWESRVPDPDTLSPEDKTVLRTCMEQLSDGERQIVALHAVAGLRHRQIAALLELPLSTVLSRYARAIKKLKQYLQ